MLGGKVNESEKKVLGENGSPAAGNEKRKWKKRGNKQRTENTAGK